MAVRKIQTIDALKDMVGQSLGVSNWFQITQDRVDAFAKTTRDDYYIHVDPARTARTPLGGTIAHGFLTLSLLPSLGAEAETTIDLHNNGMKVFNYGLNRVRFVSPVRVGKRIRMRSKLVGVEDLPSGGHQITTEHTVEIEGEQRPAMVAEYLQRAYPDASAAGKS